MRGREEHFDVPRDTEGIAALGERLRANAPARVLKSIDRLMKALAREGDILDGNTDAAVRN